MNETRGVGWLCLAWASFEKRDSADEHDHVTKTVIPQSAPAPRLAAGCR